ncbi:glycosyltransferase [Coleofasciculus sp. FACHB-1120]|uniref:glycosyltransferase n=1 Tax=Coleofasciculus sp. FACHB-1120 TaxID=2692783 RepID=UPI0016884B03|nr:glycosyltransferase [Coleofasciculus sp. FACHB-1120]MBD2744811.1 glycosyltransferase family 1 protein [Coleofasciculus sp. FACHB-1120]
MAEKLPPIYFYLPESDWSDINLSVTPDTYQEVYKSGKSTGTYNWIFQTYLRLKADGFPCEIARNMPAEGIVVAWTSSVRHELQPGPKLLLVIVCGDKAKHPYAQLHVVQNRQEMLYPHVHIGDKYLVPGEKYFIPHWPHPGLIPRDRARGDRFENVAYLGRKENLVVELRQPSWQEQMNALGLRFQVVRNPALWNDYSEIDATVAIRSLNPKNDYYWKPASKLYNAWMAGVPAILGRESAYQTERKSELDYLEATSIDEVVLALKRLRDDKELRRAIVENGKLRAEELQPDRLVTQWRTFLTDIAVPTYERWCTASNSTRKVFLMRRDLGTQTKRVRIRLSNLLHKIKTM